MNSMNATNRTDSGMEIHGLWKKCATSQIRTAQTHHEKKIVA